MAEAAKTLEGWYVLHDFRRVDWPRWKEASENSRAQALEELGALIEWAEEAADTGEGSSALFAVLGHKADLLFLHLRPTLDALLRLELAFAATRFSGFTQPVYSYVSVTELAQYTSDLTEPRSPEREAFIARRLRPRVPPTRYICFYPMSKKREGEENWYTLPMEERRRLMRSHGEIGRAYKDRVVQMISGSMGLDDWEWGVTLYSDDPLAFKKIVQEMRFDEVSAKYALFGPFFVGARLRPAELERHLVPSGKWLSTRPK